MFTVVCVLVVAFLAWQLSVVAFVLYHLHSDKYSSTVVRERPEPRYRRQQDDRNEHLPPEWVSSTVVRERESDTDYDLAQDTAAPAEVAE